MKKETPYNPLDKKILGRSVTEALLLKTIEPLPPIQPFEGAGIYAIYYTGDFPCYEPLANENRNEKFSVPIYVGKAVPAGARKGAFELDAATGNVLFKRLSEHAESIRQTKNLSINNFHCRYLVVDDIWIPLGESLLIQRFSPIWNQVVDGFGNHDPGSGRHKQRRSPWDALHPGRSWAEKLQPSNQTTEQIIESIREALLKRSISR